MNLDGTQSRNSFAHLSIDADRIGLVVTTIASVSLAWAAVTMVPDLLQAPRKPLAAEVPQCLRILALLLALIGGRRMFRGAQQGKPLVLAALVLYAIITAAVSLRRLADPGVIALLASCAALYYATATSRLRPLRLAIVPRDKCARTPPAPFVSREDPPPRHGTRSAAQERVLTRDASPVGHSKGERPKAALSTSRTRSPDRVS
jgi:hypothetical protein